MSDAVLEKVEYVRVRAPPTLNQFLLNKKMKEVSVKASTMAGTVNVKKTGKRPVINPDGTTSIDQTTRMPVTEEYEYEVPMPASAKFVHDSLKGVTAEHVKQEHPEWIREYPDYLQEWKERYLSAPTLSSLTK